jgi:anhydro-N-acetylmuramic acid kinase
MVYRVIGLMSGSSLDGLDIAFVEFLEQGGKWSYQILHADCYPYSPEWTRRLKDATQLSAREYQLLHVDYGHYLGHQVKAFIDAHKIHYQVALISSHGHTTFHDPARGMTAQLGDGAALAAETQLPVVTDLRAMDVAFGGQGAPIVPIGEKFLLQDYSMFLNIGGIANITLSAKGGEYIAYDICAANRVLNMLAQELGSPYDKGGKFAAEGHLYEPLLQQLGRLDYYKQAYPKSLANEYGTGVVYPLIKSAGIAPANALHTYAIHIAQQTAVSVLSLRDQLPDDEKKMLVTGGGAFNDFLIQELKKAIEPLGVTIVVPETNLVNYKEALIMAFIGVLRWRQEYNVLSSVTGASRDSIGGALWTGQEA